jgi:translation elongation factor EF-1beta
MPLPRTSSTITRADLDRIEATIKKALQEGQKKNLEQAYIDLLEKIVDGLNELRLTVQFDHEERIRAIEDFLQEK